MKLTEPNVVTYYLRSAVLGQVIAELDGAGTRTAGFIYLGAKLLARQAQNGSITFEHDDPSRTKLRYTHAQLGNQTAGSAELDPMGAEVYGSDPYLEDPGFEGRGEGFGEFGDVSEPSTGCSVDGLYSPCDIAFRLLQQGAAVEAPTKLTRYNRERKRFEFFRAYADGYAGFLPTDARYYGNGLALSASGANGSLNELAGIIELDRTTYSSGGQLSPCLRDALRQFFPPMKVHGRTYSPVDDARFKSGIPSVLNIFQDNNAVTLGLYDIYFNPDQVNLNGGRFDSLDTIVEELSHTVQFLQTWAKQPTAIYIGVDLGGYDAAKAAWAADYAYYAAKGRVQTGDGYKNDVERWAKNRTFDILSAVLSDKNLVKQGNVCGYDLTNYSIARPDW